MDRYLQFVKGPGFYPLHWQINERSDVEIDETVTIMWSNPIVLYTLIGPRWFKPFAYRSFPVSTPKQGLNVVAFRNIMQHRLVPTAMFFATLGNKETSPTTSKKEEKVPNHQTGRTIRVFFPYSQEQILRGHCELQPSATTAGIPVHSTRHWAGNVLGRTASPRIRWNPNWVQWEEVPRSTIVPNLQLFSCWLCPSTATVWDSTSQRLSFIRFFPTRRLHVVFRFWAVTGQPLCLRGHKPGLSEMRNSAGWEFSNRLLGNMWSCFHTILHCPKWSFDLQEWREEIVLDIHQRQISVFQRRWFLPVTDGLFRRFSPQLVAPRSLKIEEVSIADCRSGRQGHSLMITCWVASEGYSDI